MTTLTTNNHKLLIVEVPEKSYAYHLDSHAMSKSSKPPYFIQYRYKDVADEWFDIELPMCGVNLLGTITSGKVDFDCEGLVEFKEMMDGKYYRLYGNDKGDTDYTRILNGWEITSKQSFLSLLQSKGIEYKKCVVLRIN